MRTTVNIDASLLERAKLRAAERRETLGDVINDALRRELAVQPPQRPALKPLPTSGSGGVRPGIDLTSNRSIQEALDAGLSWDKLR